MTDDILEELMDAKFAAIDEAHALRHVLSFLAGYAREDFAVLLDTAAKAMGGREAEIAAEFAGRARNRPEEIRQDIGGWISGPCLRQAGGDSCPSS